MRAVVQRVTSSHVDVLRAEASGASAGAERVGQIAHGLTALVGVAVGDTERDAAWLADKLVNLRLFEDPDGKMNLSLLDVSGALLAISQFTLLGDARKGRRPSFTAAMEPAQAERLFEHFCTAARSLGCVVETGRFRTHMRVSIENDGPVTLLIDSKREF